MEMKMISDQSEENEHQIHTRDEDHCFKNTGKKHFYSRLISTSVKRELREMYRLAWPAIFISLFVSTLSTQSIFFCGRIGKSELAAGTLAISIFTVFGLSIAYGMCSALDTLCSQAYGANNFRMLGVVLQRGFCILSIAIVLVGAFWLTTEHFLLVIGIEPEISRMVDQFVMILLPVLPATFGSQLLIRYLIAQGIVRPTLWIGLIVNLFAVGLNYLIVILLEQGFWGVAISFLIASYCNLFLIIAYIVFTKVYKKTWMGWSFECLYNWKEFVWLALPGMLMICLEWWSFEVGAFLMGNFGESTLAAHGVLIQIVTLTFMIPFGISAAAAVRVGQNLGANEPSLAKLVMKLAIGLNLICVSLTILIVVTARKYVAMVFSNSWDVIEILMKTIPIMAILCFFDSTQGVCSGIVRGCGQQRIGVIINFISYDFVAIPLGVLLAFVIDWRLAGMWWGLSVGVFVQSSLYITLLCCTNWKKQTELAQKRAGISHLTTDAHQITSTSNDPEQITPINGYMHHDERNGDVTDQSPAHVYFAKASSLNELEKTALTTGSVLNISENVSQNFLDQSQTKHVHRHSKKRIICMRIIPLVIALLILCGTVCVRFLVPLPTSSYHHHSNNTSIGNQTANINSTQY